MTKKKLRVTKRPTNRRTDRRTDKVGCRVACTRLEFMKESPQNCFVTRTSLQPNVSGHCLSCIGVIGVHVKLFFNCFYCSNVLLKKLFYNKQQCNIGPSTLSKRGLDGECCSGKGCSWEETAEASEVHGWDWVHAHLCEKSIRLDGFRVLSYFHPKLSGFSGSKVNHA